MKKYLKIKIKAFVKTVRVFTLATLLSMLVVGALCGMVLGFGYLLAERIITPFTFSVVGIVIVIIFTFIRCYREMYKKLKEEENESTNI